MLVYGGEAYKAPICLFVEPLEAMEGVYWATYGRWAASFEGRLLGHLRRGELRRASTGPPAALGGKSRRASIGPTPRAAEP